MNNNGAFHVQFFFNFSFHARKYYFVSITTNIWHFLFWQSFSCKFFTTCVKRKIQARDDHETHQCHSFFASWPNALRFWLFVQKPEHIFLSIMTLYMVQSVYIFFYWLFYLPIYFQIKVFCDKGAERKARDEERRANKRKMNNTGAFHVHIFSISLSTQV